MYDSFEELDNLDAIENGGMIGSPKVLSNVYPVKIGGFGENHLKTYISSVKLSDLQEDIQFYETLSKDKSWPISQIIQREVDKRRVNSISKDYILGQGRVIKYFPPIIIALLPKGSDDKINLKYNFYTQDDLETKQEIYQKSRYKNNNAFEDVFLKKARNISLVDGFYLLEVSKIFDFNVICWDKNKYFAVVIDGQHRLDALIKSKQHNPEIGNYIQDVVFIDFSHLVKESGEKHTPVELVRRVFIDINTNAKKVGVVRQILMDDKDLAALLVQSLVDSVNKDGSDKQPGEYLRSQIVDWYGESLKHTLPHITGVLSLYQILSDYMLQYNLTSIDSLRKAGLVNNWVKKLNNHFFVDRTLSTEAKYGHIKKLNTSILEFAKNVDMETEFYDDGLKESVLFSLDYGVLEVAQHNFEAIYSRSIVKIFEELLPYKDTLDIIEHNRGFDPESLLSVALLSSREKVAKSIPFRDSLASIKVKLENALYKKYYLLFTVLGQKSLFNMYFKRVFRGVSNDFNNEKCIEVTQLYINDINELLLICNTMPNTPFGKKDEFLLEFEFLQDNNQGEKPTTADVDAVEEEDFETMDIMSLGTILSNFWEGIIYENNKIIYNSQGILSLTSMIEFMLKCVQNLKSDGDLKDVGFEISYAKHRTARIIKTNFGDGAVVWVDQLFKVKEEYIKKYLITAYDKFKQQIKSNAR